MPKIVSALQAVVAGMEAVAAELAGAAASGAEAAAATPVAGLAAPQWSALLSHAMVELEAVLGLLALQADWKAQISGAFVGVLRTLLAARRAELHPMLAGFRAALVPGRQRLPLTGADAAQVGGRWGGAGQLGVCCRPWGGGGALHLLP